MPEVVDDEQRDGRQFGDEGFAGPVERGIGELLQQGVGLAVEHAVALVDRGAANRLGEMTLAGARWAQEEDVFALLDEAARREFVDERAIHLLVEVEVKGVERAVGVAKAGLLQASGDESILRAGAVRR